MHLLVNYLNSIHCLLNKSEKNAILSAIVLKRIVFYTQIIKSIFKVNTMTLRYSSEISLMVIITYFASILALDIIFYLSLNSHIDEIHRFYLVFIFLSTGFSWLVLCMVFLRVNNSSRNLIPVIRKCLYNNCWPNCAATRSYYSTFLMKIIDLDIQQSNNKIGIYAGKIFIFTRSRMLRTLLIFIMNLLLMYSLFRILSLKNES